MAEEKDEEARPDPKVRAGDDVFPRSVDDRKPEDREGGDEQGADGGPLACPKNEFGELRALPGAIDAHQPRANYGGDEKKAPIGLAPRIGA